MARAWTLFFTLTFVHLTVGNHLRPASRGSGRSVLARVVTSGRSAQAGHRTATANQNVGNIHQTVIVAKNANIVHPGRHGSSNIVINNNNGQGIVNNNALGRTNAKISNVGKTPRRGRVARRQQSQRGGSGGKSRLRASRLLRRNHAMSRTVPSVRASVSVTNFARNGRASSIFRTNPRNFRGLSSPSARRHTMLRARASFGSRPTNRRGTRVSANARAMSNSRIPRTSVSARVVLGRTPQNTGSTVGRPRIQARSRVGQAPRVAGWPRTPQAISRGFTPLRTNSARFTGNQRPNTHVSTVINIHTNPRSTQESSTAGRTPASKSALGPASGGMGPFQGQMGPPPQGTGQQQSGSPSGFGSGGIPQLQSAGRGMGMQGQSSLGLMTGAGKGTGLQGQSSLLGLVPGGGQGTGLQGQSSPFEHIPGAGQEAGLQGQGSPLGPIPGTPSALNGGAHGSSLHGSGLGTGTRFNGFGNGPVQGTGISQAIPFTPHLDTMGTGQGQAFGVDLGLPQSVLFGSSGLSAGQPGNVNGIIGGGGTVNPLFISEIPGNTNLIHSLLAEAAAAAAGSPSNSAGSPGERINSIGSGQGGSSGHAVGNGASGVQGNGQGGSPGSSPQHGNLSNMSHADLPFAGGHSNLLSQSGGTFSSSSQIGGNTGMNNIVVDPFNYLGNAGHLGFSGTNLGSLTSPMAQTSSSSGLAGNSNNSSNTVGPSIRVSASSQGGQDHISIMSTNTGAKATFHTGQGKPVSIDLVGNMDVSHVQNPDGTSQFIINSVNSNAMPNAPTTEEPMEMPEAP